MNDKGRPSINQKKANRKNKTTRRMAFLMKMDNLIPWDQLADFISPIYPSGKRGRPPIELRKMIRMYFLQRWYELADEALEDAIHDSTAMQQFIGIDIAFENIPDATTLLKFRRLLNDAGLTEEINELVVESVARAGFNIRSGTVSEASAVPVHKPLRDFRYSWNSSDHDRNTDPLWNFAFHTSRT
ncbi:TPA: transposase [Burkholderia cenocepacia]|nr:transposase [Burkholderia cenocepacia]HDR9887640.1 transposase [Burkholderia cenocepacia]